MMKHAQNSVKHIFVTALLFLISAALYGQSTDLRIVNRMMKLKMEGLIPLRFANALDGKPVAGAAISIAGIGDFVTDAEGIITFPEREDGRFTLSFEKEGFISASITFEIVLSTVIRNHISVSPVIEDDYFRIVLDWGERPADLDLHFEKDGAYHISWRETHSAADGSAALDRDDTDGYGPETITVMRTERRSAYTVYVSDYTNRQNANSPALSQSAAVVCIYGRAGLIDSFEIPPRKAGNRWNVFKISNGKIIPVNVVTYTH